MSLSVERLKEILAELDGDWRNMCMSPMVTAEKLRKIADEQTAIRELIAIKEAEPVEIVSSIDRDGFAIRLGDKALHKSTKLIIKPE